MKKLLKQNQNVIIIAIGLFLVSMTALLFILNLSDKKENANLKTEVFNHSVEETVTKEEETDFEQYAGNNDEPYVVLKTDGTIYYVSPDFRAAEGYKVEDVENKLFFAFIKMEDLVGFMGSFGKVISKEKELNLVGPYRLKSKNGTYHQTVSTMKPIIKDSKVSLIVMTVKDITEELNNSQEKTQETERQ